MAIEYGIGNIWNFILGFLKLENVNFQKKIQNRAAWCMGPKAVIRELVYYSS
jgi:hypothetical protein